MMIVIVNSSSEIVILNIIGDFIQFVCEFLCFWQKSIKNSENFFTEVKVVILSVL